MNAINKTLLATLIGFAGTATLVHADDVGPDRAMKMVQDGRILSFEKLNEAALAKHPEATVEDTELEEEYGRLIYQMDLRDAQGQEWDLELDATNGEILREERDD